MNFIDEKGFNDLQSSLDRGATSDSEPSFMAGSAGALFDGAANGFAQVSSQAAELGYTGDDSALGGLLGIPSGNMHNAETIRQNAKWASDTLRPDPQTTGAMAQILFGVGDVGARFAAGLPVGGVAGGAALSGTSVGKERYDELIGQGVDPQTALGAAAIRGLTTGAGALLPAGIGGSLLARVGSGVGINVAAGAGGRAAEGTALSDYKQGQELKAFRAQDVAVDAILGGIFGGVSRLGIDVTHDQFDAAMTLKNAKSANIDSMPGNPASVGDIARHAKAMDTAIDDILNERTVSVDATSVGAKFTPAFEDPQATYLLTPETPAPPSGYVRLYRGEHKNQDRGVFSTGEADDGKVGGWFSRDQSYADSYRDTQEQGRRGPDKAGRVVFVDVPESQLTNYQVAGTELGKVGIRVNEDAYFIDSLRRDDVIEPQQYVAPQQSYADIVKSVFDEEGYGRVYAEMTRAEEQAGQIDRSYSQFAPEQVAAVPEPSAFRDIQSETFRDLLPEDRVTASRDVAGLRAGDEVRVRSVDEAGNIQVASRDGVESTIARADADTALDVGLNIRRPVPDQAQIPTEFGRTEPANDVLAAADREIQEASAEGKAYDAAIDCFLSRGN